MAIASLTSSAYTLMATGPCVALVSIQSVGAVRLVVASSLPLNGETNFQAVSAADVAGQRVTTRSITLEAGEKLYGFADRSLDVVVETTPVGDLAVQALGMAQVTVTNSAQTLVQLLTAASALSNAIPSGSRFVDVIPEGDIRYRDDGVSPTTSVGWPIVAFQPWRIGVADLTAVRFIATGNTAMNLAFYK